MAQQHSLYDPFQLESSEKEAAENSARVLSRYINSNVSLTVENEAESIVLPKGAVRFLVELLSTLSEGNAVTLIPIHAELTTQEAADFLGVSRPFIIKEIEAGKIEYRLVGTHRRIEFKNLLKYKSRMKSNTQESLDELTRLSQELGIGYE